jgi:hypothetical protein
VKHAPPDATVANEMVIGTPTVEGNPALEKGDVVATGVNKDATLHSKKQYGEHFYLGVVTRVYDETKTLREQKWARNGDDEDKHFDFQVCIPTF